MALAAQAALLDELMGRHRDAPANSRRSELRWDDPDICKYFICGFCPHDLFVNTRADLGPCTKIHDEEARKSYLKSSRFEKMGYEEDFIRFLQNLLSDVEKRIKRGQARLALNAQNTLAGGGGLGFLKEGKVEMLTERINELVEQAEELGCEGKVEEAQGIMKLCDQLREERAQLENSSSSSYGSGEGSLQQPKEMEVCLICGAFLVVDDAPQRQEEHVNGKQHAGYATARDFIDTWQKKQRGEDPERMARLEKERAEREKEKEEQRAAAEAKEKADREKRDRERAERDKGREKERLGREKERERRRSRDRSRERDRGARDDRDRDRRRSRHSRSRSAERRRRSRSKDRRKRSRDRSSRDRERRSSRDRDRSYRSKDRDSHHSKDKERSSDHKGSKTDSKEKKRDSSEKSTTPSGTRETGSEQMSTDSTEVNTSSAPDQGHTD